MLVTRANKEGKIMNRREQCVQCGKSIDTTGLPNSESLKCSIECSTQWDNEHPEEVAKWIPISEMTIVQRAELDALLGKAAKA